MKRGTPLRRTPLSRARLRAVRVDPERSLAYAAAREAAHHRAGGRCENCHHRLPLSEGHAHHRARRSGGRNDSPANLAWCCFACHEQVHASPQAAMTTGWLISRHDHREPQQVPIRVRRPTGPEWGLLTAAGDFVHLPEWAPGP